LSALGIAIGIAAMIAVVGISTSSRAALDAELDRLGTNLLRVSPDDSVAGADLPRDAAARVERLPGNVRAAGYAGIDAQVYRSPVMPRTESGALVAGTGDDALARLLTASLRTGTWLDRGPSGLGTAVLGSLAAEDLGITAVGQRIAVDDTQLTVVGILDGFPLTPDLDTTVFIDRGTAGRLGWNGRPDVLFERSDDTAVTALTKRIPGTLAPGHPADLRVSRPSDALAARAAADGAFTGMLIGLSGVALLVGGIGVANTMVIAVLERRREIGLRRALGATRGHIRLQFLIEALLLAALGGAVGALLGGIVVAVVATTNGWTFVLPPTAVGTGLLSTLLIGALAGAYPAARAARTPPTVALSS